MTEPRPAVVVISSHVARGSVGNRAVVHALQLSGFDVWAVPTVMLAWHPGHGPSTRMVPDASQFAAFLNDLSTGPFAGEVVAVLSGYLGAPGQAAAIAATVAGFKARNPQVRYLCDPVIGDANGLYVPEETAESIRTQLVPMADILTPNLHEFAWLNRLDHDLDPAMLIEHARKMTPPDVVVTSAPFAEMGAGMTGNLLVTGTHSWRYFHPHLGDVPNGTGDMTASLVLGALMAGHQPQDAVRLATAGVIDCLMATRDAGADELILPQSFATSSPVLKVDQLD